MVIPNSPDLVSVIIPVFNADSFLEEAIRSVLVQTYPYFEILIVDDGSSDRTGEIARSFGDRVKYYFQENRGAPSARNRGITQAKGSYIAFLDADDMWVPEKLRWQTEILREEPGHSAVVGKLRRVYSPGGRDEAKVVLPLPEAWMAMSLGVGLFRKSVFSQVGLLDESLLHCDDIDWFLRAREAGLIFKVLDRVVLMYRRHNQNMTLNEEVGNKYFLQALKKSLDRRRVDRPDPTNLSSLENFFKPA